MELFPPLTTFYTVSVEDSRINRTHISLYMALLQQWNIKGGLNPFPIDRDIIMKAAKISTRFTYNRHINDLHDYGYINYLPSSNSFSKSIIYLKGMEKILRHGKDYLSTHIDTF